MAFETKGKQYVYLTLSEAKESDVYDPESSAKLYDVAQKDGTQKRVVIASNPDIAAGRYAIEMGIQVELAERKPIDGTKRVKTQFANMLKGLSPEDQERLIALVRSQATAEVESVTPEPTPSVETPSAVEPAKVATNGKVKSGKKAA